MKTWTKLGFLYRALALAGLLFAAAGLVLHAERAAQTGRTAIQLCLEVLIPSLFPFFIVSALIVSLGYADALSRLFGPLMRGLFRVNGRCSAAFALGIVGGYPVGARTAIALYREGACSRTEAERMLAFCNNSGPAFILGVVGSGIFGSARLGLRLYAAHVLASVLVGMLFRFYRRADAPEPLSAAPRTAPPRFLSAFVDAVGSAASGVLRISAFVVSFAVLTDLLFATGALSTLACWIARLDVGLDAAHAEALLRGFLEVTTGLRSLASAEANLSAQLAMAACMLGWAGLCVHCQVLAFLEGSGLEPGPYIAGKLLQSVLSAGLIALSSRIWPLPVEAASILADRLRVLTHAGAARSLLTACAGSLFVLWVSVLPATRRREGA